MDSSHPWRLAPVALWALAGILLFTTLGAFPVTRTQEARVLVTAREMIQSNDWRDWMVPHLNGALRLEKPPLAYWLTAASYLIFGVNEFSGRLPAAIAGWLMLALTYRLARQLFNDRAALLAAGVMAGCFLFTRNARLAETDILAAFFATGAIYAFWKCFSIDRNTVPGAPRSHASFIWCHLAAVCIALTVLAKGPPAVFPILFLLVFAAFARRWDVPLKFFTSGAILTCAVIALPWFLYIDRATDTGVVPEELGKIARGGGHTAPPWQHFIYLFKGSLPWIAFTILGILVAIARSRADRRVVPLLVWIAIILIPLSFVGQKQEHYLVPILPPLMILTGWVMDEALRGEDPRLTRWCDTILKLTVISGFILAVLVPVGVRHERGAIQAVDWIVAAATAVMMTFAMIARRRGPVIAFSAAIAAWLFSMTVLVGVWGPAVDRPNWKDAAHLFRSHAGAGPFIFHPDPSIPLLFYLNTTIPVARSRDQIAAALRDEPDAFVIVEGRPGREQPLPPGLHKIAELTFDEKTVTLYKQSSDQRLPPEM